MLALGIVLVFSVLVAGDPPGFPQLYRVGVEIVGHGSVAVNPAPGGGSQTYTANTTLEYEDANQEGIAVTCTASADSGWSFDHWDLGPVGSTTTTTANPATLDLVPGGDSPSLWTLRAVFVQAHTLTVNVTGNGTVTKIPDQSAYADGTVVSLSANADPGWTFSVWTGDLSGTDDPASITMDADKTVTATFTEDTVFYTLTVNVVGSGTVTKAPDAATYASGTVVSLNPEAAAGWTFAGWSGALSGADDPASITMDSNKTVTATFTPPQYTLTVIVVGSGTVTKTPNTATYTSGTVVSLNPEATAGWTFAGWSGALSGADDPASITMDADKTVTATFTQDAYTLTVNIVGNGTVAKTPEKATYQYGDVVSLDPTPDAGWTFAGWSGDLAGSADPGSITMNSNKTVTATFTPPQYTIDVSPNPPTGGTVAGGGTYSEGTSVTVRANAASGYAFVKWTEGSGTVSSDASYIFTATRDRTLVANFEKLPYLFFDNVENGTNGWQATGQWGLQNNPGCCNGALPSPTHAWCYGEKGSYFRSGALTSKAIDVTGLTSVDLSFWYCFTLASSRYRAYVSTEVSFGGPWKKVWPGAAATGNWKQIGPTMIQVPAGAKTMRVRFNFKSTGGRGCYCIDDVMVSPGAAPVQYTVTVSVDPAEGGTVTGGGTYNQGANVTVTATANAGYAFVNWTECGQVSTSASYTFVANADRTLVAHFQTVPTHTLKVSSTAGGTVTAPGEGTFTYNEGTVVNLVATPDAGYRFVNWTGDAVANANAASTTITMDVNHSVTANFAEVTSLFFDNMENGTNGWQATGQWHLQNNPGCCNGALPSPTHAWCYGEKGSYFRSGALTSKAIDVTGLTSVDLSFWYCFTLASSRYRAYVSTEVSFGGPWKKVWPGAAATGNWKQIGPTTIQVPAGATTMRIRFNFESTGGRGCYCIDDVLVAPSGAAGALSYDASNAISNAPEFQVDGAQNTPNPVRDVHTTYFEVKGVGINLIEVQVFDQSGRSVFDSGWQPNGYEWHLETDSGETLANGIYLYVVTVMGYDGQTVVTQVKKLAVYR